MDYPPNSRVSRETEPKKVEKIILNDVTRRRKPLSKRFMETFVGGDAKSVGQYVLFDVVIPAMKDTIADVVSQAIERMLFGEARSTSRRTGVRPSGSGGFINYNRISSNRREEERPSLRRGRSVHDLDDLVLNTRPEAEAVIGQMFDIISKYEQVTIADLYELVGITGEPIDHKWGWTDLRGSGIVRIKDGYLLDLPKPEPIS